MPDVVHPERLIELHLLHRSNNYNDYLERFAFSNAQYFRTFHIRGEKNTLMVIYIEACACVIAHTGKTAENVQLSDRIGHIR